MGCSEVIIPAQSIRSSGMPRGCNNLSGSGNSVSGIYIWRSEIHQPSMPSGDEGKNRAEIDIFLVLSEDFCCCWFSDCLSCAVVEFCYLRKRGMGQLGWVLCAVFQ